MQEDILSYERTNKYKRKHSRICFKLKETILINHLKTEHRLLYLKTQSVPRCKHFSSRLRKPISFFLYGAQVTVCSQINTKHINRVRAENIIIEC